MHLRCFFAIVALRAGRCKYFCGEAQKSIYKLYKIRYTLQAVFYFRVGYAPEPRQDRVGEKHGNGFFQNTESLLRQEKGISQRKAAAALGISQALLSHYENGIREPGLAFVCKVCDFYRVSADFLLGRTANRDGAMIDSETLYDGSTEKGSLRGSIMATLQKKLAVNTTGLLFDLLSRTNSREAITAAGDCLGATLYDLLRRLYRQSGGNEDLFATEAVDFDAGAVDAALLRSRGAYMRALTETEALPHLNSDALTTLPGIGQSAAQVIHNVDERAGK